jgi:hypothetical protein
MRVARNGNCFRVSDLEMSLLIPLYFVLTAESFRADHTSSEIMYSFESVKFLRNDKTTAIDPSV